MKREQFLSSFPYVKAVGKRLRAIVYSFGQEKILTEDRETIVKFWRWRERWGTGGEYRSWKITMDVLISEKRQPL